MGADDLALTPAEVREHALEIAREYRAQGLTLTLPKAASVAREGGVVDPLNPGTLLLPFTSPPSPGVAHAGKPPDAPTNPTGEGRPSADEMMRLLDLARIVRDALDEVDAILRSADPSEVGRLRADVLDIVSGRRVLS